MKYFFVLWSNLRRRRLRTAVTIGMVMAAFLLFGLLAAVNLAFGLGAEVAGADRLVTINRVSLIQPLPLSYLGRIEQIPGVENVAQAVWFGGIYQDPKNFFPQIAVDPERYFGMYPELQLPEEQMKAWLADRTGAVVGRTTANRFGWKIGDRIPIQGTYMTKEDGSRTWEFNLVGIYDGAERSTDTTQFFLRYDYLEEARQYGKGLVGWYVVRVNDPDQAVTIAEAIDSRFANSSHETRTSTEKAFASAFASQVGDIGAIVRIIVTVVFFIILLVVGNTIAQAVRERTSELAVLKTLGFTNGKVLALVLAESLLVALLGALLGLAFAYPLVAGVGMALKAFLPVFYIPAADFAIGFGLAVALGLAAGILPAVGAMRLPIVEALRRV
jgi:putative ABC transport system permease protein